MMEAKQIDPRGNTLEERKEFRKGSDGVTNWARECLEGKRFQVLIEALEKDPGLAAFDEQQMTVIRGCLYEFFITPLARVPLHNEPWPKRLRKKTNGRKS